MNIELELQGWSPVHYILMGVLYTTHVKLLCNLEYGYGKAENEEDAEMQNFSFVIFRLLSKAYFKQREVI